MAYAHDNAKRIAWFGERYSSVSMDRANHPSFAPATPVFCPHAGPCTSCALIALPYAAQLERKRESLRTELGSYAELGEVRTAEPRAAPLIRAYRSRAKLVAQGGKLGLFARGTHDVLDLPECVVLDPLVARATAALRQRLGDVPEVVGVDVAHVGEQLLITLIVREAADPLRLRALAEQLRGELPEVAGVAYARREDGAVQLLAGDHQLLAGEGVVSRRLSRGGPYHYVSLGSFLQVHPGVASAMYARLEEHVLRVSEAPRVLELHAGSGALSLSLAARGASVTAVETWGPACDQLARAAREQRLSVRVEHGEAVACVQALLAAGTSFDVVLVNPPRHGLEPSLRAAIAALGPVAVGYVSCGPPTLARDLAHLARLGLRCASLEPFDMMPLTSHIESLAWLVRAAPAEPTLLPDQGALALRIKPPHTAAPAEAAHATNAADPTAALFLPALLPESSGLQAQLRGQPLTLTSCVFTALVRGVVRARGTIRGGAGGALRYRRERVVSGHSLVQVECTRDLQVLRAFRAIGHPVIGDPRDTRTAKFFARKHGLDRPFLHLSRLGVRSAGGEAQQHAGLAPDLQATLHSLEGSSDAKAMLQAGPD